MRRLRAASLNPASVPVGEPATLTLSVEGQGNLHGLALPPLPEIPGVRAYDPTVSDKTSIQGERFGGRHQVEIVPSSRSGPGTSSIPSLTFSWFDPRLGTYQAANTPSFDLHATVGVAGAAGIGATSGQNVLESAYRPLRDSPGFLESCRRTARLGLSAPAEPLVLGAIAFPPMLLLLAEGLRALRRRRDLAAPLLRGRRAYREARTRLARAQELLRSGQHDAGFEGLAATLFGYLEDRAGEPFAGLSLPELGTKLASLGVEDAAVKATVGALQAQEAARYAPGSGNDAQASGLFEQTAAALETLEKSGLSRSARVA